MSCLQKLSSEAPIISLSEEGRVLIRLYAVLILMLPATGSKRMSKLIEINAPRTPLPFSTRICFNPSLIVAREAMVERSHTAGWRPAVYAPIKRAGEKIAEWFAPRSEATVSTDNYRISMELPGVAADDIEISMPARS
jgi:hypothetical protein